MVQASRLALALVVTLLSATSMAGCLQELVVDPNCPTAVAANWTQEGITDAFPGEGSHGDYNVSARAPEGIHFEDPEWGELVLARVEWNPGWEENTSGAVFRLDQDGRINITLSASFDGDTLQEGFLQFITQVTPLTEEAAEEWVGPLLESRHDVPSIRSQDRGTAGDGDALVEYNLTYDGPLAIEALYAGLLREADQDERPDPWFEPAVKLGDWSFYFPPPLLLAQHTSEDGRYLLVDARDRVEFHWDPPAGVNGHAIMAGITRTLADLGLPAPPDVDEMDIHERPC